MAGDSPNSAQHFTAPTPVWRALQAYAFDPSQELDLQTARVNQALLRVRWEKNLSPGPVGDYLEVIDVDPPSRCFYQPIDLNHPHLLATDGLPPSEGSPQFHQQMVYGVGMKTIANFEEALGRTIHWAPRLRIERGARQLYQEEYVPRLRIFPHALREANAYYSPDKKAILFGYFNAQNSDPREGLPGGIVFTCLSHDVIAHEMTHAILDGIHRRLLEPTNEDTLAFHEAFGDLVAIFQHFTLPGVLEQQIAGTRGDLGRDNLLAKLAVEFGRATGHGSALRDVLGDEDASGVWQRQKPDPTLLARTSEPHARGAILVAAVFDAFLAMYQARTADLTRLASGGVSPPTDRALAPELVDRLADEARQTAQRLLTICIRALDYLPPVDVNFGDYLRALVTSHSDLLPDDPRHYRAAIIRAFRDRGIYPRDVRTLSVESLRWCQPTGEEQALLARLLPPLKALRLMAFAQDYVDRTDGMPEFDPGEVRESVEEMTGRLLGAYMSLSPQAGERRRPPSDGEALPRELEWRRSRQFARYWHRVLSRRAGELAGAGEETRTDISRLLGIDLFDPTCKFEVHDVRPTVRIRQNGQTTYELLVLITQRRYEQLDVGPPDEPLHFRFRSGCTLLIDPIGGQIRYAVVKRMGSSGRLARQMEFLRLRLQAEGWTARGRYGVTNPLEKDDPTARVPQEPLRFVHRGCQGGQWP